MLHRELQLKWSMASCLEAQPLLMKNPVSEAAGTRRAGQTETTHASCTVQQCLEERSFTLPRQHLVHSCLVFMKYQPSNLKVVAMSALRHHALVA